MVRRESERLFRLSMIIVIIIIIVTIISSLKSNTRILHYVQYNGNGHANRDRVEIIFVGTSTP